MKRFLGLLCGLSALVATGYSLSCVKCLVPGPNSCNGTSINCTSDQVCLSSYEVTSRNGVKVSEIFSRDCLPRTLCDVEGSWSALGGMKSQVATRCCVSDNCTPPEPKLAAVSNEVNGLTCPTCISVESDRCSTEDFIQCTGNETKCFLIAADITGNVSSSLMFRGCSTESFCVLGMQSVSSNDTHADLKVTCTNGSAGPFGGFSLLVITVIAIMISVIHCNFL
ncbi:phospholipase A2 inhibitor gamma subunit B-like [Pelobates fuscus]|uniref:phospholipase A2 inhibitor gamma subunit B-like n=1 Tax=Pelobates fuscus TaxID=191477 RepID=UPI002FE4485B